MAQKISPVAATKKYMEQKDHITPEGGRKIETKEFAGMTKEDRAEMAKGAVAELNKAGGDYELEIQA